MIKNFFVLSSGNFKNELKFVTKKILINLFIAAIMIGLFYLFR
jgi:hypothetical protein